MTITTTPIPVDTLIDQLITREGGYTNNPADHGGPTNFGITEQEARAYGYTGNMASLPRFTAATIYKTRYWTRIGLDGVAQRYPTLAMELFDVAVNMGTSIAGQFLQRLLNVLNRGVTDYPDIKVDNDIGPMTLHTLDQYKAKRGPVGEKALIHGVEALKGARYISIAETNATQEVFEYGWLEERLGLA